MRDVSFEGLWWLPSDSDNKIAGTASLTGDARPTLRLIGAFTHSEATSTGAYNITLPDEHTLIHGLCDEGYVTLIDCQSVRHSGRLGSPLQWRQSLEARLMLVGILLDQPDEAYFDQIVVGVDHLLAWSGQSGVTDDAPAAIGHRWQRPEPLIAQVEETIVRIDLGCGSSARSWADRYERSIEESAAFVVDVPDLVSASALIERWTKPLQDLLTLASGRACGVHEITLVRRRPDPVANESAGRPWRPVSVKAFLQPVYRSQANERLMVGERMLFTLNHIQFSEVLPNWLATNDRLDPVPAMAFGMRYISRSYVENRLITAAATAEALHRRLLPGETYLSDKEYDELRTAVMNAIPEQHRRWVDDRIWNEPSFKQRLMQLVARLGDELVEPFMPRPNRWANAAKDARNSLVHRLPHQSPPPGEHMYVLALMTSAVITLALLHEIGIPYSRLASIVTTHEPYTWIAEDGPKWFPQLF